MQFDRRGLSWTLTNKIAWKVQVDQCDIASSYRGKWDPKQDVILYDAELNFLNGKKERGKQPAKHVSKIPAYIPLNLTKRQILSQLNGIYDPLGLISPFTAKAKIKLSKLWAQDRKFDWDEPIPETLRQKWIKFFKEFAQLKHITSERRTKSSEVVGDPILVVFSWVWRGIRSSCIRTLTT